MNSTVTNAVSEYAIEVAGITLKATASGDHFDLEIHPAYDHFVVTASNPDIDLTVYYEELPLFDDFGELIFDSGSIWRLYSLGDEYIITMSSPIMGPDPYRIARFNKTFDKGQLYVKPRETTDNRRGPNGKPSICPFDYPLDEWLIINKVADGRGLDVHGCGVANDESGILFIGVSGAGKSTLANLWKNKPVRILSDDRLIVRPYNKEHWVYGTPWHGDANISMATGVPLKGLYFITQSPENSLRRLPRAEALTRLLVCCFPTFYIKDGMEKTMTLLEEISSNVPAYEFGFVPDDSAIDFVMSELNG